MSSQGEVVKNCQFYVVKRRLGGGRGQKLPILRQRSLWTTPWDYLTMVSYGPAGRNLRIDQSKWVQSIMLLRNVLQYFKALWFITNFINFEFLVYFFSEEKLDLVSCRDFFERFHFCIFKSNCKKILNWTGMILLDLLSLTLSWTRANSSNLTQF